MKHYGIDEKRREELSDLIVNSIIGGDHVKAMEETAKDIEEIDKLPKNERQFVVYIMLIHIARGLVERGMAKFNKAG